MTILVFYFCCNLNEQKNISVHRVRKEIMTKDKTFAIKKNNYFFKIRFNFI